MVQIFLILESIEQNLNTRSSTKSEIVGVDQLIPLVLSASNFLESQGSGVTENIIYQDNKSAIILENNYKSSSSKRTKYINIRYFCT